GVGVRGAGEEAATGKSGCAVRGARLLPVRIGVPVRIGGNRVPRTAYPLHQPPSHLAEQVHGHQRAENPSQQLPGDPGAGEREPADAPHGAAQQLTAPERAHALATIWAEARYNFAYWDRVRVDWDSALRVNLKLAAEPQPDLLFYRRLRRFVALLGDGQAAVLAPPNLRSRIARPPLLLTSAARRPFIMDYAENDEMRVAHPDRLAEIVAVQGVPAEAWIRDSVLPETAAATPADRWQRAVAWMLQGDKGTSLHLLIRVPGGDPRGVSVTRSLSLNDRWPLDPPAFAVDSLPGGVAVVRIGSLA